MDNGYTLLVGAKVKVEDVKKQLDTVSKDTHIDIKLNVKSDDLKNLSSTVTKSNEEVNKLIQSTKTLNDSIGKLGNSTKDTKKPMDDLGKSIDNADVKAKTMGQTFLDTTMKVAKFGASAKLIGTFQDAVVLAKDAIIEFDSSMGELRKVTDLSGESLKNFKEEAFEMADKLSAIPSDVVDATTEFSKSGFDLFDSKTLAENAIIFKTIADGEIEASDAATTLIQVTKAYNMTAEDSEHIINAL